MKSTFFIVAILISEISFCQIEIAKKIDTSNYYNFFDNTGPVNWLRVSDATPVLIEEIQAAGFSYAFIGVGMLIRVNDSSFLVLTVGFRNNPQFGFVWEGIHGPPFDPKERQFLTAKKTMSYVQLERNLNGDAKYMHIDSLPDNVFLLKQDCYWFQSDSKGQKYPVSKDVAINILRQDIRAYLQRVKTIKN
jgi:hypothetical protein